MINTVELYGRTKVVDGHREPFGKLKDGVHATSLPPPLNTIHPDIWPVSLSRNDGPKLIVGTQVLNALVTASICLDQKLFPSVGAVTSNFNLTLSDSFATKIFVDMESVTAAKSIISDSTATQVLNTGMLSHQLRQIRTRFDLPSTYTLCRASGPLIKNHTCHSYNIFTLINCDRGHNPYAVLLDAIGNETLKNSTKAKLIKAVILSCIENATGKVKEVLESILTLYDHSDNRLPIVLNVALNRELESLAKLLMPSIISWNASVAHHIKQVFEFFA
ncbi:hypothetical protein G6F37_010696 [Rhizopus arrhizus]|nr:hypothetical protein G6F38_009681 [Rhizopus arrhizus]KAG1153061.1 hypothetical protein G6F37_010696 [Rhizopus arrhizus]